MELTKDIKYDKELIQNESVKIDYSGSLYTNGSDEVYIVYGFDKEWKNTTYQKMDKTENCFSTTIQLSEYTDFNFCFKDSYNNWDNNNSCDYSLKIEVKKDSTSDLNALLDDILNETKTSKIETTPLEDSISKIQKISDTFDELFEETKTYDSVNEEIENTVSYFDALLDSIQAENTISNIQTAETLDLEKTFPEEFDSCVDTENVMTVEKTEDTVSSQIETITTSTQSDTESESPSLALITTSKHKNIFDFENLSPWYVFKKRVRLAFYKLIYVLPAFLFGEEDDSEN